MSAARQSAVDGPQFTAINPDAFKDGFSVDALITYLARDALKYKSGSRVKLEGGTAPLAAKASLEQAQLLLETLDKAEEELQVLHGEVGRRVSQLQLSINRQETKYKAGLDQAAAITDQLRAAFREVEEQAGRFSNAGLRIGGRLQAAEAIRSRALELESLLGHLYALSQLPNPRTFANNPEEQYRRVLPQVYWDDRSIAEAAALAKQLTTLTAEAHNARQRSRMVGAESQEAQDEKASYIKGSLHYTTWQVACYCYWLESRVMTRFSRCMSKGAVKGMAECASIMALFKAEQTLVEKYVSQLPVFDPNQSYGLSRIQPPAGNTASQIAAALAPFAALCNVLQSTVEEEAGRICEVFSDSNKALDLLLTRLSEEKLIPALETLLLPQDRQAAKGYKPHFKHTSRPFIKPTLPRTRMYENDGSGNEYEDEDEVSGDDEGSDRDDEEDDETDGESRPSKQRPRHDTRSKPKAESTRKTAQKQEEEDDDISYVESHVETDEEDEEEAEEDEDEYEDDDEFEGDVEHQIAAAYEGGSQSSENRNSRNSRRRTNESPDVLCTRLKLLVQAAAVAARRCSCCLRARCDPSEINPNMLLKLLQTHSRVQAMATAMQGSCTAAGAAGIAIQVIRSKPFELHLANYPYPELQWLDVSWHVLLSKQSHPKVDQDIGRRLIANNKESIVRAVTLSGDNEVIKASYTALLFAGAGPFDELAGSLLEQLAHYVIDGVEHSLELAGIRDPAARAKEVVTKYYKDKEEEADRAAAADGEATDKQPKLVVPQPRPVITKAVAVDKGQNFAQTRLSPTLEAIQGATAISFALQAHYLEVVEPHVMPCVSELSQCSSGLLLLLKAVEEGINAALQKVVDTIIIKAELTLLMEQQRSDFFPREFEAGPSSSGATQRHNSASTGGQSTPGTRTSNTRTSAMMIQDRPSSACLLVCAQLAAMHGLITQYMIAGPNMIVFLQEVGNRMQALLLNHMQQFIYNAAGALRWKCDITEYVELMSSWGISGLKEQLQSVQALSNVLVVPSESLMALVDAGLRLDHKEALKYVALRADYNTARVGGKTLQELFSSGTNTVDHIIGQATAAAKSS